MATKVIDVTLAVINNTGPVHVSPNEGIFAKIIRAQDDEQVFQSEVLYLRNIGQPIHPSGAQNIPPGQSLTYNVTKRLTVNHFDVETEGHLNQSLMLAHNLTQRHVVSGNVEVLGYFGGFNFKVRFDDINGFMTIPIPYNTTDEHKMEIVYTVNVVGGS